MKLWNIPRAGGKTVYLLKRSAASKIPILCLDEQEKEALLKYAWEELGIKIPEPIVASYVNGDIRYLVNNPNEVPQEVLIDDIDYFISHAFNVIPVEATYTARLEEDIIEKQSMFENISSATDIDIIDTLSKVKDPNVKALLTKLFIKEPKE